MEIWKDIAGYEKLYQVSNRGRVKSLPRNGTGAKEKILTLHKDSKGVYNVSLSKNGERKIAYVHRLVAEAFLPNPFNLPQVWHIDGNSENNEVDNLIWCTQEFIMNQLRLTLKVKPNANKKLSDDDIDMIRTIYKKGDSVFGVTALAKQYQVSKSTISYIVNNVTYVN